MLIVSMFCPCAVSLWSLSLRSCLCLLEPALRSRVTQRSQDRSHTASLGSERAPSAAGPTGSLAGLGGGVEAASLAPSSLAIVPLGASSCLCRRVTSCLLPVLQLGFLLAGVFAAVALPNLLLALWLYLLMSLKQF